MLINLFIGFSLITVTVLIQGYGTIIWVNYIRKHYMVLSHEKIYKKRLQILIFIALFLLFLHFLEAGIWAFVFYFHPGINDFQSFEEAMYFSLITFTSLGYGDIVIDNGRIMAGIEAANGVLMLGWSTALMFTTVNYIFKITEEN